MCLLCKDSNWKAEISKNYLLGVWTREFLAANPIIIDHHSKSIKDHALFFAEMDALIATHGSGEKAWEVMKAEVNKAVRTFRVLSGHHIPGPEKDVMQKSTTSLLAGTIDVPDYSAPDDVTVN